MLHDKKLLGGVRISVAKLMRYVMSCLKYPTGVNVRGRAAEKMQIDSLSDQLRPKVTINSVSLTRFGSRNSTLFAVACAHVLLNSFLVIREPGESRS